MGQDPSDGRGKATGGRDIRPVRILLVVPPLDLGASHLFSRPSSYIGKEGQRTQPVVSWFDRGLNQDASFFPPSSYFCTIGVFLKPNQLAVETYKGCNDYVDFLSEVNLLCRNVVPTVTAPSSIVLWKTRPTSLFAPRRVQQTSSLSSQSLLVKGFFNVIMKMAQTFFYQTS